MSCACRTLVKKVAFEATFFTNSRTIDPLKSRIFYDYFVRKKGILVYCVVLFQNLRLSKKLPVDIKSLIYLIIKKEKLSSMRLIDLDKVTPDMKLGRSIYRANGELLLSEGIDLTKQYVKRLKELGYGSVYINDGCIDDVSVDEIISQRTRMQALKCIQGLMNDAKKHKCFKIRSIKNVVSNIVEEVTTSKEIMLNLSDICAYDEYTFDHSVNVTVISIILGIGMYYTRDKLLDLGLGVILHDLGKTLIPSAIVNKPSRLTEEEYELIKQHTWYGFEILRSNPEIKITSAHVALQHHERYNGSGYPRGLKGKRILEFARISAIADVFDAMSTDRVYRKKFPVHKVYEYLVKNSGTEFDPTILDNFIQKVALYPKGTKIRLSDGRVGFVIKQNYMHPSKPIVRLFWQDKKDLDKPEEENLLENSSLSIVEALDD